MRWAALVLADVAILAATASAQTGAPIIGREPVFVPGLYETESRDTAFKTDGVKIRTCIASLDIDAFRRETIAHYLAAPQFKAVCKLSETKPLPDGFAFAMDCTGAKTIIAFRFSKDLVSSTTDTKIVARPEYSSSVLTLSRRIGACSGKPKPLADEDL